MLSPDLVGWIGNFFFIFGAFLLARKNIFGFVCNGIGNFCYLYQGFVLSLPSLVVISFVLFVLNIYGIKKWGSK